MITISQLDTLFPERRAAFYDLYRDGVTQGTLNKWLTCPESARLGIQYGLAGSRNLFPLEFGSVFHEILEDTYDWFRTHPSAELPDILIAMCRLLNVRRETAFQRAMANMDSPKRVEEIDFTYALAEIVARRYFRAWECDFTKLEWVAIEFEFEFWDPKGHFQFPIRGKVDGVYRDQQDKLWLFETKTKSIIDNDAVKSTLPLNMQVGLYSWVVEHSLGQRPVGVMYNMVKRPGQRRKVKETTNDFLQRVDNEIGMFSDDYFMRYECSITFEESATFQNELRSIMKQFELWYLGVGPHYRNSNSCSVGPFTCEYLHACGMGSYDELGEKEFIYPELPEYRSQIEGR